MFRYLEPVNGCRFVYPNGAFQPEKVQRPTDRVANHVRPQASIQSGEIALFAHNPAQDIPRATPL